VHTNFGGRNVDRFKYNMYLLKCWLVDKAGDILVLILAIIIWTALYGIYYSSGLKIMVHLDTEWEEQMVWQ